MYHLKEKKKKTLDLLQIASIIYYINTEDDINNIIFFFETLCMMQNYLNFKRKSNI